MLAARRLIVGRAKAVFVAAVLCTVEITGHVQPPSALIGAVDTRRCEDRGVDPALRVCVCGLYWPSG